jgi:ABC-type iron transport system FetAB permease component
MGKRLVRVRDAFNRDQQSMSPRIIVKEKVAIFIIATVVLLLNLFLLLDRIFSFLGFLLVLLVIFVGANAAFRLIDRRRKSKQGT